MRVDYDSTSSLEELEIVVNDSSDHDENERAAKIDDIAWLKIKFSLLTFNSFTVNLF